MLICGPYEIETEQESNVYTYTLIGKRHKLIIQFGLDDEGQLETVGAEFFAAPSKEKPDLKYELRVGDPPEVEFDKNHLGDDGRLVIGRYTIASMGGSSICIFYDSSEVLFIDGEVIIVFIDVETSLHHSNGDGLLVDAAGIWVGDLQK